MPKKPHILIYGHYFPNPIEPNFANFVFRNLVYYPDDIEIKVVAPIPWFLNLRRGKKQIKVLRKEVIQIGTRQTDIYRPGFLMLPKNLLRGCLGWLEHLTTINIIKKIHKTWPIDLVHVNFAYPDGIATMHICKRLKIPYVITEHQGAISKFLSNPYLKHQILAVYTHAAQAITVSEFTRKSILACSKLKVNFQVIPNGVMVENFPLHTNKEKPLNLVFIGNLIETKGIHLLLEAIAVLQKSGITFNLSIIGGGKFQEHLIGRAKELHLTQSVHFLGTKQHSELIRMLPEFDILVLPSFIESFSIVLIEAMAAGLPVLATRCGGPDEIVTDDTGVLIEPHSVPAIVSGLQAMISHWDRYDPVRIRQYVETNFSMTSVVNKIVSIYNQILKENNLNERN